MEPLRRWSFQRVGHELPPTLVAIPAIDWCWTAPVAGLLRLRLPPGSEIAHSQGGSTLVQKRTALAEGFLSHEEFGALFFLDSDMVPPPDTLERLLAHRVPIVGGLYFQRSPPHEPCATVGDGTRYLSGWQNGGLRLVDGVGTGAMLIRREALTEMPRPWFDWAGNCSGEDVFFCRQAARAGIPVYCDTSVIIGHMGATSVGPEHSALWKQTASSSERQRLDAAQRIP